MVNLEARVKQFMLKSVLIFTKRENYEKNVPCVYYEGCKYKEKLSVLELANICHNNGKIPKKYTIDFKGLYICPEQLRLNGINDGK
ncbi:MAG: hypothetical protein PHF86_08150 [Candidatus Nanoarchaeia archaeon]|nr:hypothetical protein [Candidatus Nanoarchaeia archaeon]